MEQRFSHIHHTFPLGIKKVSRDEHKWGIPTTYNTKSSYGLPSPSGCVPVAADLPCHRGRKLRPDRPSRPARGVGDTLFLKCGTPRCGPWLSVSPELFLKEE